MNSLLTKIALKMYFFLEINMLCHDHVKLSYCVCR